MIHLNMIIKCDLSVELNIRDTADTYDVPQAELYAVKILM